MWNCAEALADIKSNGSELSFHLFTVGVKVIFASFWLWALDGNAKWFIFI